jgi:hypothetical protein
VILTADIFLEKKIMLRVNKRQKIDTFDSEFREEEKSENFFFGK